MGNADKIPSIMDETTFLSSVADDKGVHWPLKGMELIGAVNEHFGDTILLQFSGGKDSIATWLQVRDHFNVIPYFMYWVPGAKKFEESLPYYEEYFGQRIMRLPHPYFWEKIRNDVFQPPDQVAVTRSFNIPRFSFSEIEDILAEQRGLDPYISAVGMRAADNLDRRNMIKQKGAVGLKKRKYFYPIWDWKLADIVNCLIEHDIKVPHEYALWGRTPVSYTYRYIKILSDRYPEDYETLKTWLPLIDLELFRYEVVSETANVMLEERENGNRTQES